MKKIKYIMFFFASLLFLSSCETLDLAPEDHYGSGNFWQSEEQIRGYVYGLHNNLRGGLYTYFLMGEARGGLHRDGTSSTNTSLNASGLKVQDLRADNAQISNWGNFYNRILQVNNAIAQVSDKGKTPFLDDDSRGYFLGQLYGLRSYHYFWLYRTYGGVPLIQTIDVLEGETSAENLYTARSSASDIMAFLKDDIQRSVDNFGDDFTMTDGGAVWNKYASLMLKADIYMWSAKVSTGDYQANPADIDVAEAALKAVENQFSLLSSFADVFDYNNKGNDEIIFAIRFRDGEATNFAAHMLYSADMFRGLKYDRDKNQLDDVLDLRNNGLQRHEYRFELFESYSEEDQRRDATFYDYYDLDDDNELVNPGTVLRKFKGLINNDGNRVYADDVPVYRYADVLLMLAEVANFKGEDPAPYINQIRERAYGENYDEALHGYSDQGFAANELAILFERDKEFVWENKRWFDILRMHADDNGTPLVFSPYATYGDGTEPVLDQASEAHKILWPIDVNTLNDDPLLEQTSGY
ncbi:RagB/SusD family nutrient uptake outer membrane protein [Marinilabiliaceae bacterium ANBcel2]|nr:RagB/SusD family nutrient uptake outer membrane protein [Marinilabiliaceae bacterium ANBcel2]